MTSRPQLVRKLAALYTTSAPNYRDLWAPALHPICQTQLAELTIDSAERVLDVGTGVGTMLPDFKQRFASATVIGVDRSLGMLSFASDHAPVAAMDAARLGFASERFDLVFMSFMLFHVPDPVEGLAESRRVLRSGGTIALTTWASDDPCPAEDIWADELEAAGAPPMDSLPGLAQHELMDSPDKVRGLLNEAGFGAIRIAPHRFEHSMPVEDFVVLKSTVGRGKQRLDQLTDGARTACVSRARTRLFQLPNQTVAMPLPVILTTARA